MEIIPEDTIEVQANAGNQGRKQGLVFATRLACQPLQDRKKTGEPDAGMSVTAEIKTENQTRY